MSTIPNNFGRFSNFVGIQSGDPVQVTLKDGTTTLDGTFRQFIGLDGNNVVVTTPLGENDPTLQTRHYLGDITSMVTPIPPVNINNISVNAGDLVEVRFDNGAPHTETGVVTRINSVLGIIEINNGVNDVVCKDFWSITKL